MATLRPLAFNMASRAKSDSKTESWSRGWGSCALVVVPSGLNLPVVACSADMLICLESCMPGYTVQSKTKRRLRKEAQGREEICST